MSDIIRVKTHSKKKRRHGKRHSRARSLAPASKKFEARFPRTYRFLKKVVKAAKKHPIYTALASAALLGGLLVLFSSIFPEFALSYSNSVGHSLRLMFATVTSLIPLSVGEILILLFLLFLPVWAVTLFFALRRKYTLHRIHTKMRRVLLAPIAVLLAVTVIFCFSFAPSYYRPPLSEVLGISESEIYDEALYDTLEYMVESINSDLKEIEFDEHGSSVMSKRFSEMSTEVNLSFYASNQQQFSSIAPTDADYSSICPATGVPAKAPLFSGVMPKFGIAGVYTFFTAEANVSTAYPDFCLPHTCAHELAHQRGIASENDADFIAFITCAASADPYIRYSGHLNALLTMRAEIADFLETCKESDPEYAETIRTNVNEILGNLDERVAGELSAYQKFLDQNRNEVLTDISTDFNDAYLKSQGQSAGKDSYQHLCALIVNFYTNYMV